MPSRAYTSFLHDDRIDIMRDDLSRVNALSGLYLISTEYLKARSDLYVIVSMPSRAYTSFLLEFTPISLEDLNTCVNALSGLYLISTKQLTRHLEDASVMCQCPLGLIPHFYVTWQQLMDWDEDRVNALSGLYLISTVPLQKPRFYAVSRACFCRYLSEYSDNSRFSCMLTFWTYLMRCTYP